MKKDKIFKSKRKELEDFNFRGETARVFDDMLDRSVPFYSEIQRMMCEMAADFAKKDTNIYDLGCSTCNTLIELSTVVDKGVTLIGVDSSPDMLKKGKEKIKKHGIFHKYDLECQDLNKGVQIMNASVVILNLTLQFVRPLYRQKLIRKIYEALNENGCIILVEKVISPYSTLNRLFIKYYYDFKKRNGYSQMEIAKKREALENILIPYHMKENQDLLLNSGFKSFDVFFRWYNFCGMVAVK